MTDNLPINLLRNSDFCSHPGVCGMLWHVALQRTTRVEIMARSSAGWTIVAFAEQGQGMTFSNKKFEL